MIIGGDEQLPELNPQISFLRRWPLFDLSAGLGKNGSLWRPILFPISTVDAFFAFCHIPSLAINYFWLFLIEALQAACLVRLLREVFPECNSPLIALFCGIFAIVNPYNLITFHTPFPTTALAFATFPGLVAAAINCARNPRLRPFVEYSFFLVLNVAGAFNLAVAITQTFGMLSILLVLSVRYRHVLTTVSLTALFIGMYGVWIPSELRYTSSDIGQLVSETASYSEDTLRVTSEYSRLSNSVRLVGEYLFFNKAGPHLYLPEGPSYSSNIWLILLTSLAPLLAALSCFLAAPNQRHKVWPIAGLTLIALFFAKGAAWPGAMFLWLFEHLSVFHAYRDSFNKLAWMVVIGYALLASKCLQLLSSRLPWQPKARTVVPVLAIAAISIAGYPVFLGHLFFERTYVAIPSRYFQLANWLNAQPDGDRLLELPVATNLFATYRWGYVGAGLLHNLIVRPIVARLHDFGSPGTQAIDDIAQDYRTGIGASSLAPVLGMYGVRYVLNDPSIDPAFFAPLYADPMNEAPPHMTVKARFDDISVYAVGSELLNPLGFAAARFVSNQASLPAVAAQCAILGSCKGDALIDERDASSLRLGPPHSSGASAGEAIVRRALTPSPYSLTVRYGAGSSLVSDFADRSHLLLSTSGSKVQSTRERGFIIAGKAPVTVRVRQAVPVGSISNLDFHEVTSLPSKHLCASALGVAEYRVPLPLRSISGAVSLIAFKYSSPGTEAAIQVSADTHEVPEGVPPYYFYTPLSYGLDNSFSRLLLIPANARAAYLQFFIKSGIVGGCGSVSSIMVATATQRGLWKLRGTTDSLHATPLYASSGYDIASAVADSAAVRRGISRTRAPTNALATDANAGWSPLNQPIEFLEKPFVASGAIDFTGGRPATLRVQTGGGAFDVHAFFGHLVPGVSYLISFKIAQPSQVSFRAAIVQESGKAALVSRRVNAGETYVTMPCTVPPDTSSVRLYLYFNESRQDIAPVTISEPAINLVPYELSPVALAKVRDLPMPHEIRMKSLGAGLFNVSAHAAPASWLFVFNTTYDPLWNLEGVAGISQARHVRVNLFMNGWIIKGPSVGDQSFRLVYGGQHEWVIDVIGSVICLLFSVVLFVAQLNRRSMT